MYVHYTFCTKYDYTNYGATVSYAPHQLLHSCVVQLIHQNIRILSLSVVQA